MGKIYPQNACLINFLSLFSELDWITEFKAKSENEEKNKKIKVRYEIFLKT